MPLLESELYVGKKPGIQQLWANCPGIHRRTVADPAAARRVTVTFSSWAREFKAPTSPAHAGCCCPAAEEESAAMRSASFICACVRCER
jgi:hypothetical protein